MAWAGLVSWSAWAQEAPTPPEEEPAAEEGETAAGEVPEEPTVPPELAAELEKLQNSLDRPWLPEEAPSNPAKPAELPLNALVLPEATAEAPADPDAIDEGLSDPEEPTEGPPRDPTRTLAVAASGIWFTLTSAELAGTLAYHWSDGSPEAGWTAAVLGAPAGIGGAVAYNRLTEPAVDPAFALLGAGTLGAFTGYELAEIVLGPDGKSLRERALAWSTLGNLTGAALAIGFADRAPHYEVTAGAMLGATAGWQVGASIGNLTELDYTERLRARSALELAGAYTFGAGLGLLHHKGLDLPEPAWVGTFLAEGAWVGAWLPWVISNEPTSQLQRGSFQLGLAAGYLTSLGVSPWLEPTPKLIALQTLGFSVGTLIGVGVPISTPIEGTPRQAVIPMLLGGVGGQVLGTVIEPRYHLSSDDLIFAPLITAWAGYQVIGWSLFGDSAGLGGRRTAGVALTTAGVGLGLAWGLPMVVDPTPQQSVMMLSAGLWGTWYGAWSSYLLDASPAGTWAGTLTAGDVALLGATAVGAVGVEPSWRQVGLVNAAGAAGAGFGALVGVLASPDPRTVGFSSLVGTTLGLAGGTVLAIVREPAGSSSTLVLPGLRRPRLGRLPFVLMPMAAPYVDAEGNTGVMVQLSSLPREVLE